MSFDMSVKEAVERAAQHHRAGEFGTAEVLYDRVLAVQEIPEVIASLGTMYVQAKAVGRGIVCLKYAHSLMPESAEICANIAIAYRMMDNTEESVKWGLKSIELDPNNPATLNNLASAHINAGEPEKAMYWADEALKRCPDMFEASSHRSLAFLEMGRFEEGWATYDYRMSLPNWHRRPYDCPQWKGERTKLLAISGEQGLGDEIMFLTCLAQVRGMVDSVVLEVAPRLKKLIANSTGLKVYGTCEELLRHETPTAWTHMGSLPQFIWPVRPNAYLRPTVSYPRKEKRRVGLSWRGGTMQTHERLRNFQLDYWKHLISDEYDWISLQYGDRAGDAQVLGIEHDQKAISDLDVLAAMIESCDLVVSITNTTVHMAGALGVPCIALVPSKPAWRYGVSGDRMVWYDSVRLLRQQKDENWRSVIDRVQYAINEHFHGKSWNEEFGKMMQSATFATQSFNAEVSKALMQSKVA